MNIAKLTISYDRGVSLNKPDDLLVVKDVEKKSTGDSIRSLVEAVRCQKIKVVDVKRSLDKLVINVDTETLSPRRTPKLVEESV